MQPTRASSQSVTEKSITLFESGVFQQNKHILYRLFSWQEPVTVMITLLLPTVFACFVLCSLPLSVVGQQQSTESYVEVPKRTLPLANVSVRCCIIDWWPYTFANKQREVTLTVLK